MQTVIYPQTFTAKFQRLAFKSQDHIWCIFTCPRHNIGYRNFFWIFMHKIFSNMLTGKWIENFKKNRVVSCIEFWTFMHKILNNMSTDELIVSRRVGMNWNFMGRRKRGGDDVDINAARSLNPAPCYYQHQLLLLARINKSAKQSSTRVNNCVLYLTLLQSDTNPCLDCITLFCQVLKYTKMSS